MSPRKRPSSKKNRNLPSNMATVSPITIARKALASLHNNPNRALINIQEAINNHVNLAYLHYTEAIIRLKNSRNMSSDGMKRKSLKHAAVSAKKALELAPNSIEYAHCFCLVLFALAKINGEYQEVVDECCRGLAIENPQDPGLDRLHEEGFLKGCTKERRVERVKDQIRRLIRAVEDDRNKKPVDFYVGDYRNVGTVGEGKIGKKMAKTMARAMAPEALREEHDAFVEARRNRIEGKNVKGTDGIRRKEPPDQVRDFWKRMSAEDKLGLLKVDIDELKEHKNKLVDKILNEAVEFAKQEKKWKYWKCCLCKERFTDSELWIQHVRSKKLWTLDPHLETMLPELVPDEWIKTVEYVDWKPMNIFGMLNINKKGLNGSTENSIHEFGECNSVVRLGDIDENCERKSCDDIEKAELIQSIQQKLQFLLQKKCFAMSHLRIVMNYTISKLESNVTRSQIEDYGLDQTLQSICFLEVPQLVYVLETLDYFVAGMNICSNDEDSVFGDNEKDGIMPKIDLSSDFTSLILDERLLLEDHFTGMSGPQDHKAARISAVDPHVNNELPGSDGFLNWLFWDLTTEEHLQELAYINKVKMNSETTILERFSSASEALQTLFYKYDQRMGYLRALKDVESKYFNKRNEDYSESSLPCLVKDRNALTEEESLQLTAITNILKEAEALRKEAESIHLTDGTLLSNNEEYQEDYTEIYIQKAIKKKIHGTFRNNLRVDTKILLWKDIIQQLERQFEMVCIHDYQPHMLHLLKSFIQGKLGILAQSDAIQKSDAAEKALLAKIAIDAEKNVPKACRNGRKRNGKSKNRRKNKKQNSSENYKGTFGSNLELPLSEETVEQDCYITHTKHANYGTASSSNADEMIIKEYEEANQKLDEVLEYQRQFEEEARRKHLEKQEELVRTSTKDTMQNLQVVYGKDSEVTSEQTENLQVVHGKDSEVTSEKIENFQVVHDKDSEVTSEQMENSQVVYGKASEVDVINKQEQPKLSKPVTFICSDIWFGSFSDEDQNVELVAKSQSDGKSVIFDGAAASRLTINHAKVPQDCSNDRKTSEEDNLLHDPEREEKGFQDDGRKAEQMEKADDDEDENLDLKAVVEEGIRKIFDIFHKPSYKVQQNVPQQLSLKDEESSILLTSRMLVAIGLKSDTTEFDDFLSAIIQSVWHVRWLQNEIIVKAASPHQHIGIPCIVCGIHSLLSAPGAPIATSRLLKAALSELYCYIGFFEKEQVNTASKVVKAIFDCLHKSSTMIVSHCASNACLDDTIFKIKSSCCFKLTDEESRLASNVISNNLQEQTNCGSNRSDECMRLKVIKYELPSNPEYEERRNEHPTVNTFTELPQIVTIVLEWKVNQNAADRSESLMALSTSLDIGVLYPCLDSGNKYCLVSMICNRGRDYHCFAYSHEHEGWVFYNGTAVMVIGQWTDVMARCMKCNLLPQVLFFEAG